MVSLEGMWIEKEPKGIYGVMEASVWVLLQWVHICANSSLGCTLKVFLTPVTKCN